jgi:hypothetical protein
LCKIFDLVLRTACTKSTKNIAAKLHDIRKQFGKTTIK